MEAFSMPPPDLNPRSVPRKYTVTPIQKFITTETAFQITPQSPIRRNFSYLFYQPHSTRSRHSLSSDWIISTTFSHFVVSGLSSLVKSTSHSCRYSYYCDIRFIAPPTKYFPPLVYVVNSRYVLNVVSKILDNDLPEHCHLIFTQDCGIGNISMI